MNKEGSASTATRILDVLHRIEDGVLSLLLGVMILLAPLQIMLRSFFETSIAWADPLIRVLVLWVGLLGAVAASRSYRHITIDALSRVLSKRNQAAVNVMTSLFTVFVSCLVAIHAGRFVASEFQYGSLGFAGIPAWSCEIVIPFAFGVIALRYLLHAFVNVAIVLGLRRAPE